MKPELFIMFMRGYDPEFILARFPNVYKQRIVYWYRRKYLDGIEKANEMIGDKV